MVVAAGLGVHALRRIELDAGGVLRRGAAVIGIIAVSAYKLTRKTIGADPLLWAIYLISAGCTIVTETEIIWLFLGAGLIVWVIKGRPKLHNSALAVFFPFGADAAGSGGRRPRRCCGRSRCFSPRPARLCLAAAWRSCRSCMAAW